LLSFPVDDEEGFDNERPVLPKITAFVTFEFIIFAEPPTIDELVEPALTVFPEPFRIADLIAFVIFSWPLTTAEYCPRVVFERPFPIKLPIPVALLLIPFMVDEYVFIAVFPEPFPIKLPIPLAVLFLPFIIVA